jgi:DNA-binding transcriptional ArsR family regulator
MQVVDPLTTTLAALASPTRRAIVARLARGEASVTELCKPFHLSQPAISRHLKVLERAGVISRGRSAQFRPCHLETERLKGLADWLDELHRLCEERGKRPEARLADAADSREEAKQRGRA